MRIDNYITEINQLCHCEALEGDEQGEPKQTHRMLIKATSLLRSLCALSGRVLLTMTWSRTLSPILVILFCSLLSASALAQSRDTTSAGTVQKTSAARHKKLRKVALIVVDGQIYKKDLKTIDANTIAEITILKPKAGMALYGKQAANGVILITTKKRN